MNEKVLRGKLKRACVDCNFLTELKFHRIPDNFSVDPPLVNGFDAVHYEPDSSDREQFRNKDFSRFKHVGSLGCYLGCWVECSTRAKQNRYKTIVETDRNHCCLFFGYTPTMSFQAAEKIRDKLASSNVGVKNKKTEDGAGQANTRKRLSKGLEYIRFDDDEDMFYAKVKGKTSERGLELSGQPLEIFKHLFNQYDPEQNKASETIDEVLYQAGIKKHKRDDNISGDKESQLHVKVKAVRDELTLAGFDRDCIKVISGHCELYIDCSFPD